MNELIIETGGKACSVQPYISVSDTVLVEEKLENEAPNYRLIVSEIICNRVFWSLLVPIFVNLVLFYKKSFVKNS